MNRREFLERSGKASIAVGFAAQFKAAVGQSKSAGETSIPPATGEVSTLPGTLALTGEEDFGMEMIRGIHRFLQQKTMEAAQSRLLLWNRDYRSAADYNRSVSANRESFRQMIGAVDPRVQPGEPELLATLSTPALVARLKDCKVFAIRWRVFDPLVEDFDGLDGEGLLLQPDGPPAARIVAIPDADWTPEMLVGLAPGVPAPAQFARRLAENGCQVIVPLLMNRADTYSGIPGVQMTNEPHREWIYRMAFEVGRHVVGFEVQKVLAAVDWFCSEHQRRKLPIGVIGYGEGGLLALYSAAIDTRIDATMVSGYFQPREDVWQEPIYRDIWGLVQEFGDAELASLIAPRGLIVEACHGPQVSGPPPATDLHLNAACPNGKLMDPPVESVRREVERARQTFAALKADGNLELVISEGGIGTPGSEQALRAFLCSMGVRESLRPAAILSSPPRPNPNAALQLRRQFEQMVGFTQALIRKSPEKRAEFWKQADRSSPEHWKASTKYAREFIWEQVIGRLPSPSLPANARTRLIFEEPKFHGYEVLLDVWPNVFAYGILLVPKDIRNGERRPVVVCQHGLEGRPRDVADPNIDDHFYHRFAARLAEEGFVTYAPQNPYLGNDDFRILQRLGHPLKLSLFSFILGQHEQMLRWLATQPFVDNSRIGFYGLSYGGKTAVRVPPLLDQYALSICSGDFNEWIWKTTSVESAYSYLLTKEYDMYEFNFANLVNYAELANLMVPRPFMVERGHHDPVGMDEWIAYEYAKVKRFYDEMGVGGQTAIEYFNGPHTIHGVGTFKFLHQHLNWQGNQSAT